MYIKLTVKLGEMVHTTADELASYPLSKFRQPGYYSITETSTLLDIDQESIVSDATDIYWPIDAETVQDKLPTENKESITPKL